MTEYCRKCKFRKLCEELEYSLDCENEKDCEHYGDYLEGLDMGESCDV